MIYYLGFVRLCQVRPASLSQSQLGEAGANPSLPAYKVAYAKVLFYFLKNFTKDLATSSKTLKFKE